MNDTGTLLQAASLTGGTNLPKSESSDSPTPTVSDSQWAILAGLRFFLALTVLVYHAGNLFKLGRAFQIFEEIGGDTAVLCFFVISGFSIAHSVTVKPKNFFHRRIDRIYPGYFIGIILATIPFILPAPLAIQPTPLEFIGQFFFLQGFAVGFVTTNGPIWTLSCEMFYYLCAPLFAKAGNAAIILVMIGSVLLYIFRHFFNADNLVGQPHGISAACLIWSWLLGFLAYRLGSSKSWFIIAFLGGGSTLLSMYGYPMPLLSTGMFVTTGCLILFKPQFSIMPKVKSVLNWSGDLSYTLYICHMPLLILMHGLLGHFLNPFVVILIPIASTVAIYHLLELPIRTYVKNKHRPAQISVPL